MGWLFQHAKLRHETPAAYFTRLLTHDGETITATVIAAAAVRSTVYAAVRNRNKLTGATYVTCAVILFKNSVKDGFGYKDMDESAGPCEIDCPDRIMRLLSPVSDLPDVGYAADWRARVAAGKLQATAARKIATALAAGDVIRLSHPVTFPAEKLTTDHFRFVYRRSRTPIFEPVERPGFWCRLDRDMVASASRETAVAA